MSDVDAFAKGALPRPKPPRMTRWKWAIALMFLPFVAAVFVALATRDGEPRFEFLLREPDGGPVRWNPCEPIRYVVNPEGAPAGGADEVHEAFAEIGEASGLRFEFEGRTDERPGPERDARSGDRWPPVLVSWASEDGAVHFEPRHYGRARTVVVGEPGSRVRVTGQIVLSSARFPRARPRHYATLLHEMGHLVGLAHVDDPHEVMYPHLTVQTSGLGRGDREGLRRLGQGGCLRVR